MKKLFILFVFSIGAVPIVKSQEIIPFPDLSENHIAVYNQVEMIDNHNYSLYTKDYQDALLNVDQEIESIHNQIGKESNKSKRTSLQSEKAILVKKRKVLLQEAELLEDLYKFY